MLKATMPVTVFFVGVLLGTEKYSNSYAGNMLIVAIGVAVASYGAHSGADRSALEAQARDAFLWCVLLPQAS
jgi:hypothetical protein